MITLLGCCAIAMSLSACGGGSEKAAQELYGQGLAMEQKSADKAATIYQSVIAKYPASQAAHNAQGRIDAWRRQRSQNARALLGN